MFLQGLGGDAVAATLLEICFSLGNVAVVIIACTELSIFGNILKEAKLGPRHVVDAMDVLVDAAIAHTLQ